MNWLSLFSTSPSLLKFIPTDSGYLNTRNLISDKSREFRFFDLCKFANKLGIECKIKELKDTDKCSGILILPCPAATRS